MRWLVAFSAVLLIPSAAAFTIEDGTHDVGNYLNGMTLARCAPAIDIVEFSGRATDTGFEFALTSRDLSPTRDAVAPAMPQCYLAVVDYHVAGSDVDRTMYVTTYGELTDPAWRAYDPDTGTDFDFDVTENTVTWWVDAEDIGVEVGGAIHGFDLVTITHPTGVVPLPGLFLETDRLDPRFDPCDCRLTYGPPQDRQAAAAEAEPAVDESTAQTDDAEAAPVDSANAAESKGTPAPMVSVLAGLAAAACMRRLR